MLRDQPEQLESQVLLGLLELLDQLGLQVLRDQLVQRESQVQPVQLELQVRQELQVSQVLLVVRA